MTIKELEKRKIKVKKIIKILKKLFIKSESPFRYRNNLELLVSVILSAQCTDKKVNEVTKVLFKKYTKLNDYVNASLKDFEQDIRSTGFYKNKAKNILASAKIIKEKHNGRVPKTMDEMLSLPGVARKTANIVLGSAHGIIEGIAVDTHVKRLTRLLELTDETDPNRIEQDLMQMVPKKQWLNFNHLLVNYGKIYCPSKPHDHKICPLSKLE